MHIELRKLQLFERIEGEKRQHAPYVLTWICECGDRWDIDLSKERYLSSPVFGEKAHVYTECDTCGHEPELVVVPEIVLTLVDPER